MRRLVVALIAVLMLVSLAGCGGGGDDDAGEVTQQTEVPPESGAVAGEGEEEEADLTPLEIQTFEPFPTDPEVLTDEISQRLDARQAMIVFYYDDAQNTAENQRAEIDAVLAEYRGLIELVAYDAGKYVTISEDGTIDIVPGMLDDETAKRVALIFSENYLDVTFTPYTVFVNDDGYITHRFRGFVDRDLIEREVLRATE